jgi:hypothetical protein
MKNIKPSELIRLAVDDLKKVEAMPETYVINMGAWHEGGKSNCMVCLAGAVMAMTLHVTPNQSVGPGHFPECVGQLSALNYFRAGSLHSGLTSMGVKQPRGCSDTYPVVSYATDPYRFKQSMLGLAAYLEGYKL